MAIEPERLLTIARDYVAPMTSIRGRRVTRLLIREFSAADCVVRASGSDGSVAVLALYLCGSMGVCNSKGTGKSALIQWSRLDSAGVAFAYDLLKDSLPPLAFMVDVGPSVGAAARLTVSRSDVEDTDWQVLTSLVSAVMRRDNCETFAKRPEPISSPADRRSKRSKE
ncbi:hypothetical protein BH09PSE6_BH09PSE6_00910 [soil metagenome]